MRFPWPICLLALAACASSEPPPHLTGQYDQGVTLVDAARDLVPQFDTTAPPLDIGPGGEGGMPQPDAGCTLGTAQNCASCGDVCPPGKTTSSTVPVCSAGTCTIHCAGENYDVNAGASDGCEAADDAPLHTDKASAKSLGKTTDCKTTKKASAVLPSDDRQHLVAPVSRPNGREDWYKLEIEDSTWCVVDPEITVALTSLPTGARYAVESYYVCKDDGSKLTATTKTLSGGASTKLSPSTRCSTVAGDDSGTVYVRVVKVSGTHSKASYTVTIVP